MGGEDANALAVPCRSSAWMSTIKDRVPSALWDPLALVSVGLLVLGLTVGYVLIVLGISVLLGLVLPAELSVVDGAIVVAVGLVSTTLGYLGWRGFAYFSY